MPHDCDRDGHCGHQLTGAETHPPQPNGTVGVWCCWCPAWVRVPWHRETVQTPGHGPRRMTATRVLEWPEGWRDGDAPA